MRLLTSFAALLAFSATASAGLPETFTYRVNTTVTNCNFKKNSPCTLDEGASTIETIELKAPENRSSLPVVNPTVEGEKNVEIALADGRSAVYDLHAAVDATQIRLALNVKLKLLSVTGQRNIVCGATAMQVLPKAKRAEFALTAIAHCVNPQDHELVSYVKMEIENAK